MERTKKLIAFFTKKLPRTDRYTEVSDMAIEQYEGILPERLLKIWQIEGFRGYGDGIVWTVDPNAYEEILKEYLRGTPFETLDNFSVFMRGAFGDLYAIGQKTGGVISINTPYNGIVALKNNFKKPLPLDKQNSVIESNFMAEKEDFDYYDIKTNQSLFDQAYEKFGMLKSDEVYAFKKRLCAGGVPTIENIEIENIFDYVSDIKEQCGVPKVPFDHVDIDIDKLV
jgi:hypothetical protein